MHEDGVARLKDANGIRHAGTEMEMWRGSKHGGSGKGSSCIERRGIRDDRGVITAFRSYKAQKHCSCTAGANEKFV